MKDVPEIYVTVLGSVFVTKNNETSVGKHSASVTSLEKKYQWSGTYPHYMPSPMRPSSVVLTRGFARYAMRCDIIALRDQYSALR